MYNGNTVIEKEIRDKYNEVFKIIGERVGLSKLTYETYMGLRDGDTRKNKFRSILEDELKNRKSADVSACIDTINKDVKREDKIDDKIDSFFKLGEKIYPKKEEKVVTPPPARLFETTDDEEPEEIEENSKVEEENLKNELNHLDKKKKNNVKKIISIAIAAGINAPLIIFVLPPLVFSGSILGAAGVLTVPALTAFIMYNSSKRKSKKRNSLKQKNIKKNDLIQNNEEEQNNTKNNIKEQILYFGNDLDSPTELDFGNDMEDEPLEADAISEPVSSRESDEVEESAEEMPEVETEISDSDSVEPLSEPEYEEEIETPSARESGEGVIMPEGTSVETEEENINKIPGDRRQRTIYEAEQTIMEINKKIEGYEQTINEANQRMKEIQDNKYGYPNQYHVDARHVTKPKREYNELKNQKVEALKEMKKYQDIVHDLSERVDKIRGTEVPPVTEEVTKHQVPINNWDTKDIYIVNKPDSRIKESVDYTDKFESSRKK